MEMKEKNAENTESSLLLLPKTMFSYSDMSGSPLLMPVALENTEDAASTSFQNSSVPHSAERQDIPGTSSDLSVAQSVCQLEQPLLMRRPSPGVQEFCTSFSQEGNVPIGDLANAYTYTTASMDISAPTASIPQDGAYSSSAISYQPYSGVPSAPPRYYAQTSASIPSNLNSTMSSTNPVGLQSSTSQDHLSQLNNITYTPYVAVRPHWLFRDVVESKEIWCGFSQIDTFNIENVYQEDPLHGVVPTDGGRYDVHLGQRVKKSVYVELQDLHVRRGTWFYFSESLQRHIPYEEEISQMLEQYYFNCTMSGQWQQAFDIPGSGTIVMDDPQIILHYVNGLDIRASASDTRPVATIVKRGLPDGFEVARNESPQIDHIVFVVQGIGSFCDLRFRTVSQCVDGFRDIADRLIASHFKNEVESKRVGRVEFLPLSWHAQLHETDIGFDKCMQKITLPSIPKLRHFTNDTLLDILLYSSPSYCKSIIETVANELNKLYEIFLQRNPTFCGQVSVAGHSLGSLILFDLLANQPSQDHLEQIPELHKEMELLTAEEVNLSQRSSIDSQKIPNTANIEAVLEYLALQDYIDVFKKEEIDFATLMTFSESDLKDLGLPKGPRKKLLNFIHSEQNFDQIVQPVENTEQYESGTVEKQLCQTTTFPECPPNFSISTTIYPKLLFKPAIFFALGSPISMFLAVRGYETISEDFKLPTCPAFFHIFHPYDPVAYRVEQLINPHFTAKPVLIPHHKGRKRMHLEIRENLTKMSSDISQKVIETLRYTWNSLSGFARAHTFPSAAMEAEVDKLVKEEMSEFENMHCPTVSEIAAEDIQVGCLNGGRRIDYVLQERPIEALNDYLFALTSHSTYWNSEDTVLMILKEIYVTQGISMSANIQDFQHFNVNPLPSSATAPLLGQKNSMADPPKMNPPLPSYNSFSDIPPVNYPPTLPHTDVHNSSMNVTSSQNVIQAQPLAPPPLTGFIKKSPFMK